MNFIILQWICSKAGTKLQMFQRLEGKQTSKAIFQSLVTYA